MSSGDWVDLASVIACPFDDCKFISMNNLNRRLVVTRRFRDPIDTMFH